MLGCLDAAAHTGTGAWRGAACVGRMGAVTEHPPDKPARPRPRVVLLFAVLLASVLSALVEGGARLWSAWRASRDAAGVGAVTPPLTPAEVEAFVLAQKLGL